MTNFREQAESLFTRGTTIEKDLKMNFLNLSDQSSLTPEEYFLTVYTLSVAKKNVALTELARAALKAAAPGLSDEQLQEASEIPAIGQMLNTYYKFRHFLKREQPDREADYGPAKLRMMSLGNPKLGKEKFEMLVLAISIINGCEPCVNAHERTLTNMGFAQDKLHDIARLTATVNALATLIS
jgi:lipoyl-dependent peroxiredoxin subunit D